MPRPRAPHGSPGGYRRHKDNKERVCDACQDWKDAERADKAMNPKPSTTVASTLIVKVTPRARLHAIDREIDYVQETLSNLQYVEDAMADASADKIGPLSKRKSELLRELRDYRAEHEDEKPTIDPIQSALDRGVDLSNVTPIAG